MKYLSLCSGIEAATVAWHPLGWEAVAYSEIEKFPSQVLAHHYPHTPNLGDMTKFKEWSIESDVDLLVGGTPCQSFSVAGLRKGLDDPRGNLMLTFLAIAKQYRPNWLVWENVPGVLSSNGGRDFGSFLGGLAECGYGFAYRVLDAQYFGVAQRRRRVFVVGYLGDWRPAAAVLFERHSLSGHPAPSREKRESVATYTPSSIGGYSEGIGTLRASGGDLGGGSENLLTQPYEVGNCLSARMYKGFNTTLDEGHTPVIQPIALSDISSRDKNENGKGWNDSGTAFTLDTSGLQGVALPIGTDCYNASITGDVAATMGTHGSSSNSSGPTVMVAQPMAYLSSRGAVNELKDVMSTLDAARESRGTNQQRFLMQPNMAVRRLTPIECERLQGFPDNYTDIKPKGKATPDGPRYKALGNSMAVPVMAWIGQRIEQVEAICKQNK